LRKLDAFIERARTELDIPGVAVAIAQGGKVLHARGYGVRELGKRAAVDADTLFRVGSITKSLTSLLLARLVDAGKLRWDQPVVEVDPGFRLGDSATTTATRIEHLLCACTGLPRSDVWRLFEFAEATPESTLRHLSTLQPTTGFGQAYQYSNELPAAAGYIAGHLLEPAAPLANAYDAAMQRWVLAPLGMRATTFDYGRALRGNHATGHTWSIPKRGQSEAIDPDGLDRGATQPIRPSGAAWSSASDMIEYVRLELADGFAPSGQRLLSPANLRRRRAAYASVAENVHYGIGLEVDRRFGTEVVGHGGRTFGYASEVLWLPEHGIGAVLLTNADAGDVLAEAFERYLFELLFDAAPKAHAGMTARASFLRDELRSLLGRIAVPADAKAAAALAPRYANDRLGRLDVRRRAGATFFDFGEWRSEVASQLNPDGDLSFMTITPGFDIFELTTATARNGRRQLVLRDAQQEYVFVEQ
jgi:CubicO group peptidase (beta-lactamase class C family)